MSIEVGSVVVLYLGTPREQVFGVVLSINAWGFVVRGITLGAVDDWLRGLGPGDAEGEFDLATTFYPMHRVEKVVLDEPAVGGLSIQERFHQRTGRDIGDHVQGRGRGTPEAD